MEKKCLYIPYGIKKEKQLFDGFGKRQIRQMAIASSAVLFVAFMLFIVTQTILVAVVVGVVGLSGSYMAIRKDTYSQSIVDFFGGIITYKRTQQKYDYIYDWRNDKTWKQ